MTALEDWAWLHAATAMHYLHLICQLVIGLGILNVWFLRSGRQTSYRGGAAASLKEEFGAYGLPGWMFWAVGILKVGSAVALLAGIVVPVLVQPAAITMAGLMIGAIIMHVKVKDAAHKSLPALILLALSLILVVT
ncbi:MAG: DoxX family protein [Verrucomicrobia bacterium]|nr:DoxX family protein [Verrucomicrobiota bacterium]MDA1005849.1 DoxX family protein [Verrucomicrobiota bacterium]